VGPEAFPLILGLFILIAAGLAYYQYRSKQARRQGLVSFAAAHGMSYSAVDPFDLLREPFALFQKGDGRGIENVLEGSWSTMPARVFDYWYYEESTDSNGHRSTTYYRFDCALTPIETACGALTISHENLLTRLADHLAMHDLQFELEEFNREFTVHGSDRKFANDFLDQRMMRWLLANGDGYSFEVIGDRLLCFCKQTDPQRFPALLDTLAGFRSQVPQVVYSLYPRSG
jgi:hypothetical protein